MHGDTGLSPRSRGENTNERTPTRAICTQNDTRSDSRRNRARETRAAWSRARELCTQGRMTVNGERCFGPASRVPPGAVVPATYLYSGEKPTVAQRLALIERETYAALSNVRTKEYGPRLRPVGEACRDQFAAIPLRRRFARKPSKAIPTSPSVPGSGTLLPLPPPVLPAR